MWSEMSPVWFERVAVGFYRVAYDVGCLFGSLTAFS